MYCVYVLDKEGNPLMPTRRFGKVRRMMRDGLARPVCSKPFTIRLLYEPETHVVQDVTLGIDPGRTNIGACAVREDGECLFAAETVTRNKDIPKLMQERRMHRQASRRGERLARKRLAKRLGTTSKKLLDRVLPGCDGVLHVKDIINTEARFNNRKRPTGWLTPTATQLLRTHLNLVKRVCRFLPVSGISIEVNRFSFMKMENPYIKPWEYAKGQMHGFASVKDALDAIQGRKCLLCGGDIAQKHHIVPRSVGGMDTLENLAGLCEGCHERVHKDSSVETVLKGKKSGSRKKYAGTSVLNQVMPKLLSGLESLFPGHITVTEGFDTKEFRELHAIEKTHASDAYCIACTALGNQRVYNAPEGCYSIKQYRRHDRAIIKAQTFRAYKLDGKRVAVNRKKAMEQKEDSLEDWYSSIVQEYGERAADAMRSRLSVVRSTRKYNSLGRMLPGMVFLYHGKRHVMRGQMTRGRYYRAEGMGTVNFPAAECQVACRNTGLVFL